MDCRDPRLFLGPRERLLTLLALPRRFAFASLTLVRVETSGQRAQQVMLVPRRRVACSVHLTPQTRSL